MRNSKAVYLLFMLHLAFLLSCGKPGAEYIGKWQNVKNAHDQFEITRNGDNFLVRRTTQGFFGKDQTTTVPGVLKDGILQLQGGLFTAPLTYVKDTDRLTNAALMGGNVEYERIK
jgi:hypothetical protein